MAGSPIQPVLNDGGQVFVSGLVGHGMGREQQDRQQLEQPLLVRSVAGMRGGGGFHQQGGQLLGQGGVLRRLAHANHSHGVGFESGHDRGEVGSSGGKSQ